MSSEAPQPSPHSSDRSYVGMIERTTLPEYEEGRIRSRDYHLALVQKVISDTDAYCSITPDTLEQVQAARLIDGNRQNIQGYRDEISNHVGLLKEVDSLVLKNGMHPTIKSGSYENLPAANKTVELFNRVPSQAFKQGASTIAEHKTSAQSPYEQGKSAAIVARHSGLPARYTKTSSMKL